MNRASNKPHGLTRKPSASRPGRLTPSEIESLRQEFQQDEAWMEAEMDRLEQEEASRPKQQPKNSKTAKTSAFPYDKIPRSKPGFLDGPPEPDSLFWPDDVNDVPKPSER